MGTLVQRLNVNGRPKLSHSNGIVLQGFQGFSRGHFLVMNESPCSIGPSAIKRLSKKHTPPSGGSYPNQICFFISPVREMYDSVKCFNPNRGRNLKECILQLSSLPSIQRILISAQKHTYQLYLTHAHNHITPAAAAMESCFVLGCAYA